MALLSSAQYTVGRGLRWLAIAGGGGLLILFWGVAIAIAEVNAVLLFTSLLASLFILLDFRVGVVLLIVLMPLAHSALFPHQMAGVTGLNPLNLLLVATFVSYLLRALNDGGLKRFLPPRLFWLYLVPFIIAGVLGSRHVGQIAPSVWYFEVVEFHDAAGYIRDLVVKPSFLVLFALLVGGAVARSRDPDKFIVPAMVSIWVMGLLVVGFVGISGVSLDRLSAGNARMTLSGLGLHANDLGRLYATAYALLLFTFAATPHRGLKLALAASMLLVVAALVLTFSRGAFFGFIIVNLLFIVSRRNARGLVFGAVLVSGLLFALPGTMWDRVMAGFGGDLNALTAGRTGEIWEPLLPELWRSPFFGNGLSSILWSDAMRAERILQVSHAHNAYLQALLDMGIVGLALLLAFFALLLRDFRRASRDTSLSPTLRGFFEGASIGLVSFLIAGLAGSKLTPCPEQSFLWLAAGVLYGMRSRMFKARGRSAA